MILFGVMTAIALAIVGLLALWWMRQAPHAVGSRLAVVIGALWVTSVTAAWLGRSSADLTPSRESGAAIAWPVAPKSPLVTPSSAPKMPSQVGPVESLVGRLEARLAANPNDGEGWALLAQSYAYTANEEAVERAFERAVALGVEAATLRERVDHAKRSAPAVDWVDRAIGARAR